MKLLNKENYKLIKKEAEMMLLNKENNVEVKTK